MKGISVAFDVTTLEGFAKAWSSHRATLLKELALAYQMIGRYDVEKLRAEQLQGGGGLTIRSKGLAKSFKYRATDASKATDFTKLFLSEYTRWPAAEIHQSGGTIKGRGGKNLTILSDVARTSGGRRKWTRKQIRDAIASGQLKIIPTPRGAIVVEEKMYKTKTGKIRKNSRSDIVAYLKKSVHLKKRLSFFENFQKSDGLHQQILSASIDTALETLVVT